MQTHTSKTVILVTGSSSGLGLATADRLARNPAYRVYGASRTEPKGHVWRQVPMDVTDDASVTHGVEMILEAEGRIDALVHCAGNSIAGPVETTSVEDAKAQFETNYFGALRVVQAVLPRMRERRSGKILLVGSIAGIISLPFQAHYSATKFALDGLTEALRMEIAPFGIEAMVVHPGDYDTAFGYHRRMGARFDGASPYAAAFTKAMQFYDEAEKKGGAPDAFARKIEQLLARRRLPGKSIVGLPLELAGVWAKSVLPARVFEQLFRLAYYTP